MDLKNAQYAEHVPASNGLRTGWVSDASMLTHDTGYGHPESSARLAAIEERLRAGKVLPGLVRLPPRAAEREELLLCHHEDYIDLARTEIEQGAHTLSTGDTAVSHGSWRAANMAVGCVLNAIDAVMQERVDNAFCSVRPPGHHASAGRGMGFCVFNNAAVGARYAQERHTQVSRVLIVDWDVHHGNGTQDIFYDDPTVFYMSSHQYPWYPGTGTHLETGHGSGIGTTFNAPFPAHTPPAEIVAVYENELVKRMDRFHPDLVIISAGFDSRVGDPLGHFLLEDDDFVTLTRILMGIAARHANGRLVSVLEGGYHLNGLASAVEAHLRALQVPVTTAASSGEGKDGSSGTER